MANPIVKSPFSDAIGPDKVPQRGTGRKEYDREPNVKLPQREGGLLPEVFRDNVAGDPKLSGPIKRTPFSDAVD